MFRIHLSSNLAILFNSAKFFISYHLVYVYMKLTENSKYYYFGLRPRGVPLLFIFLFTGPPFLSSVLRLGIGDEVLGRTLKKLSRRPCVDVVRVFMIFLAPLRTRSSLNCRLPHRNSTKPSSSGSFHFSCAISRFD